MKPMKIYFGAPLFSDSERYYNKHVVDTLREKLGHKVDIYLPQENEAINDKSGFADSIAIAKADTEQLLESDLLIAIMDGQTMDVGLASEIGVAYANKIPIIGLYSDSRQGTYGNQKKIKALDNIAESQFSYVNLYTVGLIKLHGKVLGSTDDLILEVVRYVNAMTKPVEQGEL